MAKIATVVSVTGKAYAYNPVTKLARLLKAGDAVDRDEIVQTAAGAQVQLEFANGQQMAVAAEQAVRLDESVSPQPGTATPTAQDGSVSPDTIIQALERGGDLSAQLEATAAGLGGGGGGQGNSGFVRLLRISESVDPLAFDYETALLPGVPTIESEPVEEAPPATELPTLLLKVFGVDLVNSDGSYVLHLGPVAEGDTALYVVLPVDADGNPLTTIPTGSVDVLFGGGDATAGVDYQAANVTVELGQVFSAEILDDYLADAGETYNIDASNFSNASAYSSVGYTGTNTVITDNSADGPNLPGGPEGPDGPEDTVKIQIFAVVDGQLVAANEIPEGQQATYVVHLLDSSGNIIEGASGDVSITFTNGTAGSEDYASSTATITLGQPFSADAIDDTAVESSENFTVNASNYTGAAGYENVQYGASVTTTIVDNDEPTTEPPVTPPLPTLSLKLFAVDASGTVLKTPAANSMLEDNGSRQPTSAHYAVFAVDPTGNPLQTQPVGTATVTYAKISADSPADYTHDATTVTVGQVFKATAVDDALADNGETFTVALNANSYSNSASYSSVSYAGTVTTTIYDETDNDDSTDPDRLDNDVAYTLALFAVVNDEYVPANEISETSGVGDYIVLAVDESGNPLAQGQPNAGTITVNVGVNAGSLDDSATRGTDYDSSQTITATVGTQFQISAKPDDDIEGNEDFTLTLGTNWSEAYKYEKVTYDTRFVTTTIVDDDLPALNEDTYRTFEDSTTDFSKTIGVLANDLPDTGLVVVKVAQDSLGKNVGELVNGTYTLSTNFGTVTMNQDGSFRYHVDAVNNTGHTPVQDSFYYQVEDPAKQTSSWVKATINVIDTKVDALHDYHLVDLDDNTTSIPQTESGNVLSNDFVSADATTLTKVTFGGIDHVFDADNASFTIPGEYGSLTISRNGEFSYTATGKTLLDTSENWTVYGVTAEIKKTSGIDSFDLKDLLGISGSSTGKWSFTDIKFTEGASIDIGNFLSNAASNWGNGSKPGWGVGTDEGNKDLSIEPGDVFVVDFGEGKTVSSSIGVKFVQANQENGYWVGYDSEGKLVDYGDLATTGNGFGFDEIIELKPEVAIRYLAFGGDAPGQGFYIESLKMLEMGTDVFEYTIEDSDGNLDTANLVFSPQDQTSQGDGASVVGNLVPAVEDLLDVDQGITRILDEQEPAKIFLDTNNNTGDGAEQTITFDSITAEQLKHLIDDSGHSH